MNKKWHTSILTVYILFPLFVDVIRVAKLQNAVCSNAAVERSFSKLIKILLKDRNFGANNGDENICAFSTLIINFVAAFHQI